MFPNKKGIISAWNRDSLWGSIDLEEGGVVNFHSPYYHDFNWLVVGMRVEVVYNDLNHVLAVFAVN